MAETHAAPAETSGSQEASDLDRQIERLLPALRHAVRRHLEYHEARGDLRPREVEPDDLVIEAVARALREREQAPPSEKVYRWLLRFAYTIVEEEVRRRRTEHAHVVASLDDPLVSHTAEHAFDEPVRRRLDVMPAPGPLPEEVVERWEFQEYLEIQLNRLPRFARVPGSGDAGVVDHVLVDPATHQATHLVVLAVDVVSQDVLVPVDWIRGVDANGFFVDADRKELLALPAYRAPRTDEEIAATVRAAIEQRLGRKVENRGVVAEASLARLSGSKESGVTRERLMRALQEVRGNQRVTSQNPETTYEALERYGRDLTQLAAQGKLDPVIGRDDEIRRVI
jgi:DNA-directed RNA polymerase specialized sigma24 family protein